MRSRTNGTLRINGIDLNYAAQGAADGPVLVLIHGYGDSWRSYLPLMDALPERFRVVAISMRGHGDSAKPARGYDVAAFAGDVAGALEALGIGRGTIVGHSMGSIVAQRLALECPEVVEQLVLIGAFATLKGNSAVEAFWRHEVRHLSDPVAPEFVRAFQQSSLAVAVSTDFLDDVVAESLKVPARVWKGALEAMLVDDQSDRLQEILAPTLVIWGDRDGFAGHAEQAFLAGTIPDARLAIQPGIGHAPHWEDHDGVAARIAAFVGERRRVAA